MKADAVLSLVAGLGMLLGFAALGEGVARALQLPLPGSVVGMALLWSALSLGLVKLAWVERAADALLSVLGLLFVPAGAGLVAYLGQWRAMGGWLLIVALGVLIGSAVAGLLAARLAR
ncbi:CidA/LrgA family protein [Deinococcus yavapaiensis]|uniref:Holin-like protein n=1 Tax=Deinococcus yavapaiensis KR-236 TaxID=694435 RepID=A0A318SG13_9DEIO|nr:CidA/LrgA family protein [Deinococcus yavapaiensis]PYE56324.1 holin-like protein [Deinococcus yavapaiensis KR-236]